MTSPIQNTPRRSPSARSRSPTSSVHQFSDKDLIGFVDPANGQHFPTASGWFYSNANYILAGLIIEAASGMNYEQALTTMIIKPLDCRHLLCRRIPSRARCRGPVMSP